MSAIWENEIHNKFLNEISKISVKMSKSSNEEKIVEFAITIKLSVR